MTTVGVDDKIVVGLDIGSTKVCAVAGRVVRNNKDQETLEVLGVGETQLTDGVAKGSVVNVNNTVSAIKRAVAEASNQSNINIQLVNVSFSGAHVLSVKASGNITRSSSGDEVQIEDIDHLVSDMYRNRTSIPADKEIVHALPMDFMVDNETNVQQPVGRNGVKLGADFQLITAQSNATRNVRKCITRNNLQQETMMLSALASGLAVLTDEEKYAGVAIVDIGGGTTEMAIYYRNILRHVAVFPWAGNSLTADIQAGCKILPNQAEQLKKRFGSANPGEYNLNEVVAVPGLSNRKPKDVLLKNVAVIMEDRLREIAALVQAEIIRSGYEGKLLGGLVLTGGTALVPGVEHIFGRVTGVEEVRVGFPEHLEPNGRADLVGDPAYATAVGLVWAGYKTIDNRISFISDPTRAAYNEEQQAPPVVRPSYSAPPAPVREREKVPEKEPEESGIMAWIRRVTKPIRGNETDPY
ncbi:cell division protein FtsA [Spirosoma utsteinense]|uniref:Cell division protein FtsA n=1 Tax=Spirosoma utsteinense TaxID=2585773 RepID=A0ABR6W6U3_9BACT|nr:cell division protein FtsA [Spirosoma utsteinense]MBC3786112.1 cell division protein FtsA [Spirosoma utsteinense]MBC3792301.1 cell division protein FtsA [Spirosoma utsteinense]